MSSLKVVLFMRNLNWFLFVNGWILPYSAKLLSQLLSRIYNRLLVGIFIVRILVELVLRVISWEVIIICVIVVILVWEIAILPFLCRRIRLRFLVRRFSRSVFRILLFACCSRMLSISWVSLSIGIIVTWIGILMTAFSIRALTFSFRGACSSESILRRVMLGKASRILLIWVRIFIFIVVFCVIIRVNLA